MQREVKSKVKREYEKRVRQVLKSKLNGANKIQALNAYAIPVVSYTGDIIDWTTNDINELGKTTRKLLTVDKALHPKADIGPMYLEKWEAEVSRKSNMSLKEKSLVLWTISGIITKMIH